VLLSLGIRFQGPEQPTRRSTRDRELERLSWPTQGPEPAHLAYCRASRRRSPVWSHSRRSALATGPSLHAPKRALPRTNRLSGVPCCLRSRGGDGFDPRRGASDPILVPDQGADRLRAAAEGSVIRLTWR